MFQLISPFLGLYMDDSILVTDGEQFLHDIKHDLYNAFEMIHTNPTKFCLKIQVSNNVIDHSIHFSPEKYLTYILKHFGMMDYKPSDIPLSIGQKFTKEMGPKDICEIDLMKTMPCVKVVGCFMYAMINTHLDLVFLVVQVAQFMANPILAHWIIVKHIFRYIQTTKDMGIIYGGES
jgi:hypothetical protein